MYHDFLLFGKSSMILPTANRYFCYISDYMSSKICRRKAFYEPFQVKGTKCSNCVVWAKSDSLSRDVIRLSSDVTVRTSSIAFYLSMFFILKKENVRSVEK